MKTKGTRTMIAIVGIFICWLIPSSIFASVNVDGIWYDLNSEDMSASVAGGGYWYEGSIEIPAIIDLDGDDYRVTSIGSNAFSDCPCLTSVTIPNSVTSIGSAAFSGCEGLASVTIPNSVTSIGDEAFCRCIFLTSVTIPNSVTSIGRAAFTGCRALTSINIPNSVTSIGQHAFSECFGLTSVTIPNSVTSIGGGVFYKCENMSSATIGNGVTCIPASTFSRCYHLTSVSIGNSVESIGDYAFERCYDLRSLTLPNSVTTIGSFAFFNNSHIASINIPRSVTSIGVGAFMECFDLETITVETETPPILILGESDSHSILSNDLIKNCILYVPVGCKSAYENAEGWKDFQNIVEILETGSCGENVTFILYPDMTMVISGTGSMDNYPLLNTAYYWEIKNVIIEDGVTSICGMAFYKYRGMTSVTIPNSVTSIGSEAFYQCYALSSVAIPNSVTYIGSNAFEQSSLQSVTIPNSVTYIGESAFYNCHYLASVTISNSVTNIGNCVFAESGLTSVDIPNSVTSIGSNAFYNCSGLLSVTIPNSVTSIGKNAFCRCSGLRSVTIPNSVTSIGESAFMECTSLCSITIPNSLTSIDCYTFASCSGLNSLTIPSSVTRIGEGAFCYTGLSSIIAESEIPPTLFYNEGYENIYMFEGVDMSTCILYVPIGSKSAYENDWGWNELNIVELGEDPNTDISTLDNAIYVDQTDGRIGRTMDIPVKVKNSYDFRGFQFTMELPEGTTVNSWKLSTDRLPEGATLSDMIATKKIDGNKIQVACSLNYGDAIFTGNDGEIATVNVTFSEDMEVGEYPIYLTACDISDAGGTDNKLSDIKATLVLDDYVDGDANGDGEVLIGDVVTILNYIVGEASDNFNAKAADANGDGEILIGDVITVLNIIVGQ